MKVFRELVHSYFSDLRTTLDAQSAAYRSKESPDLVTKRMAIVFFGAALCLLIVKFCGNTDDPRWLGKILEPIGLGHVSDAFEYAVTKAPERRINARIWWASVRIVGYLLLPMLIVKGFLRTPLGETGLSLRGKSQWKVYATLLVVVMPFVVAASFGSGFQKKYPYYQPQIGESLFPNFVAWELLYATQFIGIEYFFRGFFVHGLRRELGYAAIFAPAVPYMMIHYGKPLPEALGSLVTGFVLSTLSLRTRSIWGGALLHGIVACSMDTLSLWHRGLL
ncbi:MAG: CPBP family intramembrane metalloprotease [Polyangiaceae bacterium]|nr:CPBP family intramembrane metalloprotease [Polyangiaceae bacterium]